MTTTPAAVAAPTMAHAIKATAEQFPDSTAVRTADDTTSWT